MMFIKKPLSDGMKDRKIKIKIIVRMENEYVGLYESN